MLAHIACLWQVNHIYCFLWSLFAKRNRSWWAAFHWWNSLVNSYGLLFCKWLNILSVSTSRRSAKTRMQLSLIYFRFADFRMIRISALPVANLYLTLKPQNETSAWLIFWFLGKLSPPDSCFTELFSTKRDPVSSVLGFGLLAWDSNIAAYHGQQFLKHIYWNFMESGIPGIRIWLDLWVSANNELGKPYFWRNLLETNP